MSIIRFINKSMSKTDITHIERHSTYTLPDIKELSNEKNVLEAVVLLTTSSEINNGKFGQFIKRLISVTHEKSNIDFIISVNNNSHNSIETELIELKSYFKDIYYYNIDIQPQDDIYTLNPKFRPVPKFGLASGPNLLFINTMRKMKKYNTVLTLETDCILYENWLNVLIKYVEYGGDFLISGSTYDGIQRISTNEVIGMLHINGVALYKSGSSIFQFLLYMLEEEIPQIVKSGLLLSAYDYALMRIIFHKLKTSSNNEYIFWKVIYRYITKNTFIVNASLNNDKSTPEATFLERFPKCVILHKKSNT